MKNIVKSLALVLVLVMCVSLFAACSSGNNTDTTEPTTKPTQTTASADVLDIVGVVQKVSSSFLAVDLCPKNVQGLHYGKLDPTTLEGTGEIDYVYLNSSALFAHYTDGKLEVLKKADISVGDIIVVTKTEKGVQQIIILNYKTATPSDPTDPTGSVTE